MEEFNSFMVSDDVTNINTGIGIAASVVSILALTTIAAPIAPLLLVAGATLTIAGVASAGYQTVLNCYAGKASDCYWGVIGTVLTAVPIARTNSMDEVFEAATKYRPKLELPGLNAAARNTQRHWDKFRFGTLNSLGTATDLINRLRVFQDTRNKPTLKEKDNSGCSLI